MTPSLSIIMPIRNRERYFLDAAESLFAQTVAQWELVVVDDGSTDGTPNLLEKCAAKDPRIRVFRNRAETIAENRNHALAKARGDYVAVLDSDDIALPERFERQLAFLAARPEIGGVGAGFEFIDADGMPMEVDKYKQRLTDPGELRQKQREGWNCFMHTSMLFRRSALDRVGGYRAAFRLAEDDDLFLRLLDHCDLANLPEPLVKYRWHGGNTTGSLDSLIHRAVALASAHQRMAGLPDAMRSHDGAIGYPFLLRMLERLGDAAVPVWLMWIGVLQHYRLGEPGMLEEAWEKVLRLPYGPWIAEVERHKQARRGKEENP